MREFSPRSIELPSTKLLFDGVVKVLSSSWSNISRGWRDISKLKYNRDILNNLQQFDQKREIKCGKNENLQVP